MAVLPFNYFIVLVLCCGFVLLAKGKVISIEDDNTWATQTTTPDEEESTTLPFEEFQLKPNVSNKYMHSAQIVNFKPIETVNAKKYIESVMANDSSISEVENVTDVQRVSSEIFEEKQANMETTQSIIAENSSTPNYDQEIDCELSEECIQLLHASENMKKKTNAGKSVNVKLLEAKETYQIYRDLLNKNDVLKPYNEDGNATEKHEKTVEDLKYHDSDVDTYYLDSSKEPLQPKDISKISKQDENFASPDFWKRDVQKTLKNKINQVINKKKAKNVIFFLGDGMSIPTVTASRIYEGQMNGKIGERNFLSMEKFPFVGLSKTYCADKQVADSACSATAYMCGVKGNYKTIGLSANASYNDCEAEQYQGNQVDSFAAWAQASGKHTGIVTTTRVTHASPAGTYAHTCNRYFESDADIIKQKGHDSVCQDIASQLVKNEVGQNFKVILGGGYSKFLPENSDQKGERKDGQNLINEWYDRKKKNAKVVFNRHDLMSLNYEQTDYLLGLFAEDHMPFHAEADQESTPSLLEMTEAAIKILNKSKEGFFLFVESGLIDIAHHENKAHKALDETVELSKAIQRAYEITDPADTLIVVTADHGHTMTISGYPDLGNSIVGLSTSKSDVDGLPYSTLTYANGKSFNYHIKKNGKRNHLSEIGLENIDFKYASAVPLVEETHGGGDVAIYANGPWAHIFTGVMEQNVFPFLMSYASCIGPGLHMCHEETNN